MPKKRAFKPRVLTAADVTFTVATEADDVHVVASRLVAS